MATTLMCKSHIRSDKEKYDQVVKATHNIPQVLSAFLDSYKVTFFPLPSLESTERRKYY